MLAGRGPVGVLWPLDKPIPLFPMSLVQSLFAMNLAGASAAVRERRCRRRPLAAGGPRPGDLLARFFAAALGFLLLATVAWLSYASGVLADGRWLALHLAFLGGISQLVLGGAQFFVGAFLATGPPPLRLVWAQLACWNVGTVLVAVGVPTGSGVAAVAGSAMIVSGLVLFAVGLLGLQRRSLQRARWAVRWYYACAAFLGMGVVAGLTLALGVAWPAGSLVGAHMALNLAGWFGTAIVGTLHTFYPSLTQTRLRFGRLQGPTFAAWTVGAAVLATGLAIDLTPIMLAGWVALGFAAVLLVTNLGASVRAAPRPLSLSALLITVAQGFLVAGIVVGIVDALGAGALAEPWRATLAVLLLAGWLGLTVMASLLHLLALLARVRDLTRALPAPRPARDRAAVTFAALAVAVLALARVVPIDWLTRPGAGAVALVYAVLGGHVLFLAARALRAPTRPSPLS